MGILESIGMSNEISPFHMNTGTLFDMATGEFRVGTKNNSVLNGGISFCMGISGRQQTFKSNIAGSLVARSMMIHPQAEAIVYDTENSVTGAWRYDDFVPQDSPISERVSFLNSASMDLTDFHEDILKKLSEKKMANKKDYLVDSPFLNPRTLKPFKTWIPTFVLIDSFSQAMGKGTLEQFEKNEVDSSGMNTAAIKDGGIKTRIMQDITQRAAKVGIYIILTAHIADALQLDPYHPVSKQLQYMKQQDRLKNVGNKFAFLTSSLVQTIKAEALQDSNKQCLYPNVRSRPNEVNLINTIVQRGKTNFSGEVLPFVVTPKQGILAPVTNFHFLREHKNFGLKVEGNNQYFTPLFNPNPVKLSRQNIRKVTEEDRRTARALELTMQLAYIQLCWDTFRLPEHLFTPIEKIGEMLTHDEKGYVDRILESTGQWSTSKQDREYLSILDVMGILFKEDKKR